MVRHIFQRWAVLIYHDRIPNSMPFAWPCLHCLLTPFSRLINARPLPLAILPSLRSYTPSSCLRHLGKPLRLTAQTRSPPVDLRSEFAVYVCTILAYTLNTSRYNDA